jgi:hypothetical protein
VGPLQGDQGPGRAEGDDQDKAGHNARDAPTPNLVGVLCALS